MSTVSKKISESKGARWAALIIVSFTMMWGYFLTDALSPLMTMLEEQMGWTSLEFGQFNWAYCWFNVFLEHSHQGRERVGEEIAPHHCKRHDYQHCPTRGF